MYNHEARFGLHEPAASCKSVEVLRVAEIEVLFFSPPPPPNYAIRRAECALTAHFTL
jgi:hypothetical protein